MKLSRQVQRFMERKLRKRRLAAIKFDKIKSRRQKKNDDQTTPL